MPSLAATTLIRPFRHPVADPLTPLLNAAGRIPLLTAEEEIHLGRRIQAMIAIQQDTPSGPYTREQQIILKRGKRAMDRVVSANIKLVASCARRYRGIRGNGSKSILQLDLDDLVQEGILGLMRAAEKWDPERGYKFSTYAYWWIRQSMFRAITQKGRLIKVPHQVAETMYHCSRKLSQLKETLGREPTIDEAAAYMKMTPEDFEYAVLMTATRPASLDMALVEDGTSWVEIMGTGSADEQLQEVGHSMDMQRLMEHVKTLSPEQREMITRVYGLDGEPPVNLTQLSRERGVTRETIRQKVVRAERILKYKMAVA
jgi:RNA polymerase primary sigma factor